MTREEAIEDIRDNIKPVVGGKSLDMAIKALEQEPCIQEKQANADKVDMVYIDGFKAGYSQARFDLEKEPCDDAISRQAVLKQTYNWSKDEFLRVTNPFDYLRKRINSLPPVTPQEPVLDKIRAEIDSHCSDNRDRNDGLYIAMKIIEKYKAEREVKE